MTVGGARTLGGKDAAKAIEWYTAAAEQGHAESQYDLGFMLLWGEGTDQNTLKGMEWLIKAAEQAMIHLVGCSPIFMLKLV